MRRLTIVLVVSGALLGLASARHALADEPSGVTLEALPVPERAPDQDSVVMSARLMDDGEPLAGMPVTFYIVTTVFGERLMNVGEALSDATGTASLLYRPTWEGEYTAVGRFAGAENLEAAETTFHFEAHDVESPYEPARFGLEPVRMWLPVAVGLVVVSVLFVLGFALITTVTGIRAAAASVPAAPPLQPWDSRVQRPMPLGRTLVAAALLLVAAAYPVWRLIGTIEGPDDVSLSVPEGHVHGSPHPASQPSPVAIDIKPLAATLVSIIPTATFDEGGEPAPGSVTIPTDVAITEGRIRILDASRGRVAAVTEDGALSTVFDGSQYSDTSLQGAEAMVAIGDKLYIATAREGQVMVLNSSGKVEGLIRSVIPAGQAPIVAAGIALTGSREIWISDAANHRVIQLNGAGEFQRIIGQGVPAAGDNGFDTPGGLTIDDDGNLYVADTGNRVVKKYSPTGVFLGEIGAGSLNLPTAVAVSEEGLVVVSDEEAHLVSVFGPGGGYVGTIVEERLSNPHSLKIEGDSLYIVDRVGGLFIFRLPEGTGGQ
jgi:hypothetical protein